MIKHRAYDLLITKTSFRLFCPVLFYCFFFLPFHSYSQEELPEVSVSLPRQTNTIYSLLNQISRESGFFFIYDSEVVDNNRRVSVRRSQQDIRQWLDEILDDPTLQFKLIQRHILIFRPEPEHEPLLAMPTAEPEMITPWFTVRGRVTDQTTGNPLPYASVGLPDKGFGIPANLEGFFQLRVPNDYLENSLRISHLGYKTQEIPLYLLRDNFVDVLMESEYISMQEVVIRYYDPMVIINQMLEKREQNYSKNPVNLLSFYREGVKRNNKFLNYSEAVFRVFKAPANAAYDNQVMVVKARNIVNANHTDSLVLKLRSGVHNSLELDIMKNLPDFLDPEFINDYEFIRADIVTRNNRSLYAIEFAQKKTIKGPLFMGVLFIDIDDLALVEADFEINPRYINEVKDQFFIRRMQNFVPNIERAFYSASYQKYNGRYYLKHVRGELSMKIRRKNAIFSNSYFAFIEMAVGHIEDQNVTRFSRREVLSPRTTFVDLGYRFDDGFWGEFNVITPEKEIMEAFSNVKSKIESFENGFE